jgi:uracil-DNA glycosylase family 4
MGSRARRQEFDQLRQRVVACTRCPRLIEYCRKVAREKRRMYRNEEYWGKPLPGFGDTEAKLLILGLAPAAHGGNRTGRMFTGDRSGDFLCRALCEAGFANQPASVRRGDGLALNGCYITASVRCAPPANKPTPQEQRNCRPYLIEELRLLVHLRAVLALGRIAFDTYLRVIYEEFAADRRQPQTAPHQPPFQFPPRSAFHFAHGASFVLPGGLPRLYASYHPSQQNTQTGKLTPEMFRRLFEDIRRGLEEA